ncbi:MAG: nucleotidyltransferase family protein [Planctomycetes bacterium]|jgi:molybdenum cofactor cytidylyltransferase|nr:nucleotidyltransferase family protein [Planctomycetota bacterium]
MPTYGLIPAAGKSRRMGRPKLLLPLGPSTVIERVVAALRAAGIADVLVVVGPGANELEDRAQASGAHVLALDHDTADMRTTCEHGLAWIEERFHPRNLIDSWLLLPADHPTVRPEVMRTMRLRAYLPSLLMKEGLHVEASTPSIIVPTFAGRRGHPTLLRWSHAAEIRNWPRDQGLNAYIRAHESETLELPWPSDEILLDLDTPADYERLLSKGEAGG